MRYVTIGVALFLFARSQCSESSSSPLFGSELLCCLGTTIVIYRTRLYLYCIGDRIHFIWLFLKFGNAFEHASNYPKLWIDLDFLTLTIEFGAFAPTNGIRRYSGPCALVPEGFIIHENPETERKSSSVNNKHCEPNLSSISSQPHPIFHHEMSLSASPTPSQATDPSSLCPICHLLLSHPVITTCNHHLCGSCMNQWSLTFSTLSTSTTSNSTTPILTPPAQSVTPYNARFRPSSTSTPTQDQERQTPCPLCRTLTTVSPDEEKDAELREAYPELWAKRREEEEEEFIRRVVVGRDGVEGFAVLVGNSHRIVRGNESADGTRQNSHDWKFFVKFEAGKESTLR